MLVLVAMRGLSLIARSQGGGGHSPAAACGPLIVAASPAAKHGLQGPWTLAAAALGLSSLGAQA